MEKQPKQKDELFQQMINRKIKKAVDGAVFEVCKEKTFDIKQTEIKITDFIKKNNFFKCSSTANTGSVFKDKLDLDIDCSTQFNSKFQIEDYISSDKAEEIIEQMSHSNNDGNQLMKTDNLIIIQSTMSGKTSFVLKRMIRDFAVIHISPNNDLMFIKLIEAIFKNLESLTYSKIFTGLSQKYTSKQKWNFLLEIDRIGRYLSKAFLRSYYRAYHWWIDNETFINLAKNFHIPYKEIKINRESLNIFMNNTFNKLVCHHLMHDILVAFFLEDWQFKLNYKEFKEEFNEEFNGYKGSEKLIFHIDEYHFYNEIGSGVFIHQQLKDYVRNMKNYEKLIQAVSLKNLSGKKWNVKIGDDNYFDVKEKELNETTSEEEEDENSIYLRPTNLLFGIAYHSFVESPGFVFSSTFYTHIHQTIQKSSRYNKMLIEFTSTPYAENVTTIKEYMNYYLNDKVRQCIEEKDLFQTFVGNRFGVLGIFITNLQKFKVTPTPETIRTQIINSYKECMDILVDRFKLKFKNKQITESVLGILFRIMEARESKGILASLIKDDAKALVDIGLLSIASMTDQSYYIDQSCCCIEPLGHSAVVELLKENIILDRLIKTATKEILTRGNHDFEGLIPYSFEDLARLLLMRNKNKSFIEVFEVLKPELDHCDIEESKRIVTLEELLKTKISVEYFLHSDKNFGKLMQQQQEINKGIRREKGVRFGDHCGYCVTQTKLYNSSILLPILLQVKCNTKGKDTLSNDEFYETLLSIDPLAIYHCDNEKYHLLKSMLEFGTFMGGDLCFIRIIITKLPPSQNVLNNVMKHNVAHPVQPIIICYPEDKSEFFSSKVKQMLKMTTEDNNKKRKGTKENNKENQSKSKELHPLLTKYKTGNFSVTKSDMKKTKDVNFNLF